MRLTLTVVDPLGGNRADVVLDADAASTVADIARELDRQVGGDGAAIISISGGTARQPGSPALYVDGYAVDPARTVAESPLREGAVVSLYDPAGCLPGEPAGVVELRVAGGPDAGAVHRLGIGRVEIGRGTSVRIRIEDSELAERAAVLSVGMGGTCQVTIDGATRDWPLGEQIALGNSLLELGPYIPPNAALHPGDDGSTLDYNRPPRMLPPERTTLFRLPSPPGDINARPLPWLMALMPLVMSVTMAFMMHRMMYLLMAVVSPMVMIGNYFMDKKNGRKSHTKTVTEYRAHKERIETDAQEALQAERQDRAAASPDPATVLNTATGPRTRLWERRRSDTDHLLLRVGTAKLPSEVVLDDPEQDEHRRQVAWEIDDAPVAVELRRLGVVGFAAPGDSVRAMGRWAVAQAAALHSPMDVQFYVLTDASGQESWDWVRWLPHSRPTDGQDASALLGTDAETVAARIAELTSILDGRQKAKQKAGSASNHAAFFKDPDIVVVFDGSRRLRSLPGVVALLREGPAVGMYALCLDSEERFLPGECQAVVIAEFETPAQNPSPNQAPNQNRIPAQGQAPVGQPAAQQGGFPSLNAWYEGSQASTATAVEPAAGSFRLRVDQSGAARLRKVRPDLVSPAWCARLARCLSPIRDISGDAEDSAIPGSSRLLDVLELEPPTGDAIAARWRLSPISTQAVVGESYDGPFAIDIRKDGPHGLIAGTTGSGKSELLQTIVASLAVANTPEAMTFVLIDYKGGSAFKDCVQLPHTVGMVTDLDAHLVERALESLGAELKRREHILAEAGAKDIEDYTDLMKRQPGLKPMPRLLIVIDEFASMVRELPDFVTGLVNIAQRGRSLGIHLILATQRPSGVVSPEIRANTNLRIALRVTDASESSDVIDAPDAGTISKSTPGRAYVRLGATSLVPFQSGRVGGRRPGAVDPTVASPWVGLVEWSQLGRPVPRRPAGAKGEEDEITDLKVLVEAVCEANERLGIPPQHSPWLPALPDTLLLDDLPVPVTTGALPPAPYGIEDLPALQARRPVAVDFSTFGHLLVAGAPRSGRSQLLRTIAGSLARTHSVRDVHIYGIDCGNGALNALSRLPHCGAVVGRAQTERAIRLIGRLKAEMTRRQEVLAADGYADIGEQRGGVPEEDQLAHIVVLLDRWEGWLPSLGELDHGALTDDLFTMLREGASVGIHVIITGDRTLMAGRIATLTEDKMAFRLSDRSDFSLISVNPRKVPDEIAPGRAYRAESGIETQVALLVPDASGQGQAAAITAIGAAVLERDADVPRSRRPFKVDVLPSRLSFADAWEMRDTDAARSPLWGLVGVGGDEIMGYGPDLSDGLPAFVIGGPGKSGRSTVLLSLARSYLKQGARIIVVAPRPSPLRDLAGTEGVLGVFTESDLSAEDLTKALEAAGESPAVVLLDDAELLRDIDAKDVLRDIIARGTDLRRALVLAGSEEDICSGFSGWQVDAKKARRGALLSPQQTMSGELIGVRLARSSAGGQVTPGRALLHLGDGEPRTVTVPLA
ncbi:cell division protein FtsK [Streptomyces sp. So13.3]|uniref:FtsK/SpoIIIE domain-containing protein n=1 Tax=Streptomyces sp. So13.3 TaxID=2136173 RepID=UPI00110675B5|nr:FtsK/SpoIIIE domain-containing protein [Streptomyces sp. So13.3]QNA73942.1 cell division protein FtsK [Streptomyces sp. So13.3]